MYDVLSVYAPYLAEHHLVFAEMISANAWTNAGPEGILKEAQERVKSIGWERTRVAISTTVR